MNDTTEAFIVGNKLQSTECMSSFHAWIRRKLNHNSVETTKNMLKGVHYQLEFTYNEHSAMHLAVTAKFIEIAIF